jgi:hypothetical protein
VDYVHEDKTVYSESRRSLLYFTLRIPKCMKFTTLKMRVYPRDHFQAKSESLLYSEPQLQLVVNLFLVTVSNQTLITSYRLFLTTAGLHMLLTPPYSELHG